MSDRIGAATYAHQPLVAIRLLRLVGESSGTLDSEGYSASTAACGLLRDVIFEPHRLYVLIYIHLASRRVLLASCTSEPNTAWVTQQARNLSWRLEDEGIKLSVLIHDRDRKFALQADRVFQSQGARVILTPLMAPRANAHAERWIGSCRRECLDWMLVVNQRHLRAVIDEYCLHYNDERPHRSRNLRPPTSGSDRIPVAGGQIERSNRLGGLLSDYRRRPVAA